MAKRLAWVGMLAALLLVPCRAHADKVQPAVELGYDGLLMAGDEVKFQDPLYGGSFGVLMYMTRKNPVIMRVRVNLQGDRIEDRSGKKLYRFVSGVKWNVGMGIGRGKLVLPFVEVGLGPQFLTLRHGLKSRTADWAWTIALEGQLGFIFRIRKAFGLRIGMGFTSLSFYHMKENLGGIWIAASLVLGIPRERPYEPPVHEPPPHVPVATGQDFYFDAWVTSAGGDPARPVLSARVIRDVGFNAGVSVTVELPDGSAYEMNRASLDDPDLYEVPLYILQMACGEQWVTVKGKSGFIERTQSVQVYTPCPQMPGGM